MLSLSQDQRRQARIAFAVIRRVFRFGTNLGLSYLAMVGLVTMAAIISNMNADESWLVDMAALTSVTTGFANSVFWWLASIYFVYTAAFAKFPIWTEIRLIRRDLYYRGMWLSEADWNNVGIALERQAS